jgi:hypothetical protein
MAIVTKPMIDDVELSIRRDVSNAEVEARFTINWSSFDQLTNLAYRERWELVGVDPAGTTTIFVGPQLVNGISSNGHASISRTKSATIPWADLDEDPNGLDEIAVLVTLEPLLPTTQTAQGAQLTVTAP